MATKIIHVLQEDITNGCPNVSDNCPVAMAIVREMGDSFTAAVVCPNTIYLYVPFKDSERMETPRSVNRFINRFDAGKPVKPFNFRFRYSDEGLIRDR